MRSSQLLSSLAGRGGPLELLIVMPVPGSTALAGRGGPLELLSRERVPGSTALADMGNRKSCSTGSSCQGAIV
jgi:hypothetical protein